MTFAKVLSALGLDTRYGGEMCLVTMEGLSEIKLESTSSCTICLQNKRKGEMFKKILVPVDPTSLESAEKSLKYARTLLADDGEIAVLSVIEDLPTYVLSQVPGDFEHKVRLDTQKAIDAFLEQQKANAHLILKSGHASGTIIQTQKDGGYDLIIIASHKPHNLDYLLGSTATSVVRKAQCPVFVSR